MDFPANPYQSGSQKDRIYGRLKRYKRVTNVEIMYGLGGPRIMNTTGRASEIRKYLERQGWCLDCRPVNPDIVPGVWEYRAIHFKEEGA